MISDFLSFQANIQVYHWQTYSHSRHEAAGELYEEMTDLIDEFMEVYMGNSKKRIKLESDSIAVKTHTSRSIVVYLREFLLFLDHLETTESSLLNIRDEMKAVILRALYKFTQR